MQSVKKSLVRNQRGFTLIEMIIVIVILGILAVVAIPRYRDMQTEAAVAQANGVYGAAQAATAINFANNLAKGTSSYITTGATLLGAMDGTPDGWDTDPSGDATTKVIKATINGTEYKITVTTDETATARAALSKDW